MREDLRQACRRDEATCVAMLAAEMAGLSYDRLAVDAQARQLVAAVRRQRRAASGVDHLMHEFSLSSQEGVALMCLAEAQLRIPDSATADRLIRDKISHGDWKSHLGGSPSLFVNAATWGLLLTGKLVAIHNHGALAGALSQVLAKGGEPLIRKGVDFAMRLLGQQFVMGENIEAALLRAVANEKRGYGHSFDMLGEAALTASDAERYGDAYAQAIHAIGQVSAGRGVIAGPGISIKLSALHPRYVRSQRQRVMTELQPRLKGLLRLAKRYAIGVHIDAEETDRLELSLDLLESLAADPELAAWDGLGFAVQAYQKRAPYVIDELVELARRTQRRLLVRLVKGAYWDSEIKRTQVDGLADYPVFTHKAHTDLAYLVCAGRLLAAPDAIYPQFATHNAQTLATVFQMARARGIDDYEFQCLHGMGEALYDNVVGQEKLGKRCRIYAPVGSHQTLLPYLVRRLLENGANSSFVNRIVDETVAIDELVEDPLTSVRRTGGQRHPAIPLPAYLYGSGRRNSAGLDLADEASIAELADALEQIGTSDWAAAALVPGSDPAGRQCAIDNPARLGEQVGTAIEATAEVIEQALVNACAVAESWHQTPPEERAAALRRGAELLQEHRPQFVSLCNREAGKTCPNAIAELREAVDFCRYYAEQLSSSAFRRPERAPGPVVCISPWNFPLAIFIGQIGAALAAGCPVIAKPAEQTPLIAHLAVKLLHRAGIPHQVLQFVPGRGETVGARLTADARVRGVVFTGSLDVARQINRSIARRDGVRLIAETGGQNAMIVDSSALAEQVVQDVLLSGFDSAGQRCSALRVLCLQNDIAERTIAMLKEAMCELTIGAPTRLTTDIGPVIDQEAKANLREHIERMRAGGRPVHQLPLPESCAGGYFVPPTLIEIDSLDDLQREVFGPVIHILRFADAQLPALVDAINATGYGLTLGIHSRIDESIQLIVSKARVGNIYVNRNMIGAVVGVQPFGGEGLSGTGPKAGGPLYLPRLADCSQVSPEMLGASNEALWPPPLVLLADLAAAAPDPELAALCRACADLSLLGSELELSGPTGERNTLRFAPRGRLLCLADDKQQLFRQLAALFATGNRAAVPDSPTGRALLHGMPNTLAEQIALQPPGEYAGLAGVLSAQSEHSALRPALAEADGALLPFFVAGGEAPHYPLYRLLNERVVSVNTAAAGGNTSLLTLVN
jgi:RHH-type proline utilization regulon transcriptional repressor/proline dehydrogenase/delta 1-pyrroline-5-carboxylate dehydrogenase